MSAPSDLDRLLDEVPTADSSAGIELRDAVAAHGADALEPVGSGSTTHASRGSRSEAMPTG